jgi:hypothetical protein
VSEGTPSGAAGIKVTLSRARVARIVVFSTAAEAATYERNAERLARAQPRPSTETLARRGRAVLIVPRVIDAGQRAPLDPCMATG